VLRKKQSAGARALTFLLVAASLDDLRLDLLEEQWLKDTEVLGHRVVRVLHTLQHLGLLAALTPEPEKVRDLEKFVMDGMVGRWWVW
jgi:hypothetical protein